MLEDSCLFCGVFFGFLKSWVYLVVFYWLFCWVFLFLSHKVIGTKFTTENYRNFREFENNFKELSPGFIEVLGEPEALMSYSEAI